MRTNGMMRDADALVQHFNPACRVARMIPELPISRLLMSLNDNDILALLYPTTISSTDSISSSVYKIYKLPFVYATSLLLTIAAFPDSIQYTILDILTTLLVSSILIGFYYLHTLSSIAVVVVVLTIVLVGISREVYIQRQVHSNRVAIEKKENANMFDELDLEMEETVLQKPVSLVEALELAVENDSDSSGSPSRRSSVFLNDSASKQTSQLFPLKKKSSNYHRKYFNKQNIQPLRTLSMALSAENAIHLNDYETQKYPISSLINPDELDSDQKHDYYSIWSIYKKDTVHYMHKSIKESYENNRNNMKCSSFMSISSSNKSFRPQSPSNQMGFIDTTVQDFEFLEDVNENDEISKSSVRFVAPSSPLLSPGLDESIQSGTLNSVPRHVSSPPIDSVSRRMLDELVAAPLPKIAGPPLQYSNARIFGAPMSSNAHTSATDRQAVSPPGLQTGRTEYGIPIFSIEETDDNTVSSIGTKQSRQSNHPYALASTAPVGRILRSFSPEEKEADRSPTSQTSDRSELFMRSASGPLWPSHTNTAAGTLYRRTEIIAPGSIDSPPGYHSSGGASIATVSSANTKVERMLRGRAHRKRLNPIMQIPIASPQQQHMHEDDEFSIGGGSSVHTSVGASSIMSESEQTMRQRSSRARRRARMELQKVKTAVLMGSQHHTEGLGPGGRASELRDQPLFHTEGHSPYDMQAPQHLLTGASSGHVMPIMADLGPVQSLGSFILPSERFGATTTAFPGSGWTPPGATVGMRSSGPASQQSNPHGPGPPLPTLSSPGRYSSDSITSTESKYPMYQY